MNPEQTPPLNSQDGTEVPYILAENMTIFNRRLYEIESVIIEKTKELTELKYV